MGSPYKWLSEVEKLKQDPTAKALFIANAPAYAVADRLAELGIEDIVESLRQEPNVDKGVLDCGSHFQHFFQETWPEETKQRMGMMISF